MILVQLFSLFINIILANLIGDAAVNNWDLEIKKNNDTRLPSSEGVVEFNWHRRRRLWSLRIIWDTAPVSASYPRSASCSVQYLWFNETKTGSNYSDEITKLLFMYHFPFSVTGCFVLQRKKFKRHWSRSGQMYTMAYHFHWRLLFSRGISAFHTEWIYWKVWLSCHWSSLAFISWLFWGRLSAI